MVAHDDPRLAKVGFAKLVGSGIELYAKNHEITMGRLSKSGHVDVVLGEAQATYLATVIPLQASHKVDGHSCLRLVRLTLHASSCRRKHEYLKEACYNSIQQRDW